MDKFKESLTNILKSMVPSSESRKETVDRFKSAFKTDPAKLLAEISNTSKKLGVDQQGLRQILEKNNHFVAYRGRGVFLPKERLWAKIAYGDVDDHFLLFNRKEMINRKIFNQPNALDILKTVSIESFLSKILKENFKKEELYHYLDMTENRCMNPFNFDEDNQFYHCSTLQIMEEKLNKEIAWK